MPLEAPTGVGLGGGLGGDLARQYMDAGWILATGRRFAGWIRVETCCIYFQEWLCRPRLYLLWLRAHNLLRLLPAQLAQPHLDLAELPRVPRAPPLVDAPAVRLLLLRAVVVAV